MHQKVANYDSCLIFFGSKILFMLVYFQTWHICKPCIINASGVEMQSIVLMLIICYKQDEQWRGEALRERLRQQEDHLKVQSNIDHLIR